MAKKKGADAKGSTAKDVTLSATLAAAKDRFERAWRAELGQRAEALDDLKFRAGEQWPADIATQRTGADRPVLTVNRMPQFVRQVTGDIRLNRPSIKVRPADGGADVELADTLMGLVRHIESASDAQSAYITAAEASANCGIGHFRILTQFSDDDTFEQDIRIQRILNPFAVYWDPGAEELTKKDANWCFVAERMQKEDFEAHWPEAQSSDFESGEGENDPTGWEEGKTVRVAEYWVKEPVTKTLALLESGETLDITGQKDVEGVVRTREVRTHKVVWYKMSGAEILEGPMPWAGKYIPVIPVIGEEVHIGDRLVRHGIIRFAKDPQRLYNYSRTMAAESINNAPKAPYIMTPNMLEGHKAAWDIANKGNPAYLLANPDMDAQGILPQRTAPPTPPAALFAESNIAADDMHAVTGIYPASLGAKSNETSGVAIANRQREGDVGTFVYVDNLSKSIRHGGDILVDLIPKIYDTERTLRILGEDGTEEFVPINTPATDEFGRPIIDEAGNQVLLNDVSVGKYDVEVTTGPSFSTKRAEAGASLMDFAKAVPEAAAVMGDLIAKNMDWPGADVIAERLKKLLPPGLAEQNDDPDEAEQAELDRQAEQKQQQDQLQQMAVQLELAGAQADLAKVQAETSKAETASVKAMAEAERIEAMTDGQNLDNAQKAQELAMADGSLAELVSRLVETELAKALLGNQPPPEQGF